MFVILDKDKPVGLAVTENGKLEVYCASVKEIPLVWQGHECVY